MDTNKMVDSERNEHDRFVRTAHLFNEGGKWKYEIELHYELLEQINNEAWENWDHWKNARDAFYLSTVAGVSGVTLNIIPDGWMLVIFDPWGKNGYPIMVKSA